MRNRSLLARDYLQNGRLNVPVIDMHTHMGAVYGTSLPLDSMDDMMALMDRQNIEAICCAPHSALYDPGVGNVELETAMRRYPGRIYGYYSYNPNYEQMFAQGLEKVLYVPGYVGLKFLPSYHRYALDGPAYAQALRFAAEHNKIVLCHTWGDDPYNAPEHARRVMERHPSLTLILGHSAPGECEASIALARDYENVYLDLCDIHRHNGMVDRFVNAVGADKVLFGTDLPWYDPSYCMGSILFSRIKDEDKEKIFFLFSKRLLHQHA